MGGAGSTLPSLGLATLAAVCRENGFKSSIIEATSEKLSIDAVVDRIHGSNAHYIGITALTCSINSASDLASRIKEKLPAAIILVGGPHMTALPLETMTEFPVFDVGFIGESEHTIVDYLQATEKGTSIEHVKGIVFRTPKGIQSTPNRPFIADLDTIPFPAWDLIPHFPGAYIPAAIRCMNLPATHIITTRGCPMTCSFCDRSVFGTRYRLFSVDYIWKMICTLTDTFGVRDILFEDDSFTLNRARVISLCTLFSQHPKRISWSCLGRVDAIDAELLFHMKKGGCWQIGFGIESGNVDVLEGADKRTNLLRIRAALSLTKAAGIRTKGFFILGLPGETQATIEETIRFALSVDLDDISVSFATPFPKTVFCEQALRSGTFEKNWSEMNLLNPVFIPHNLTKHELKQSHSDFLRRFYLRPAVVFDYFRRGLGNVTVCRRLLTGLIAFLRAVKFR